MERWLRWALVAASVAAVGGCFAGYDSRWGEEKKLQQQRAAQSAPTLRGEGAPADEGKPPSTARKLRVRAYVARAYTTQVIDVPRTLRDLFEDANDVTEPALGVRLELEGIRSWEIAKDDDLKKLLTELRSADAGSDVDWVVGFVGALPRTSLSFHDLGMAETPGRHVVLRAPSSAARHDETERSYSELSEEERARVQKDHRRHRTAAVFLHEVGHTLGSLHERSDKSIMYPEYRPRMTTFGPDATLVMRAVLERRDAKTAEERVALLRELGSALRRAPENAFFEEERRSFLPEIDRASAAATPPPEQPKPAAAAPDVPELSPEDRATFARARELADKGDAVNAWETSKSLFGLYPDVLAVQDFRCNVATKVFSFENARRECERLMQLARQPRR